MTSVQISGNRFLISDLGAVDSAVLDLADISEMPTGNSVTVYDPSGPNGGSNLGSVVVSEWSNTLLDFYYDALEAGYPTEVVRQVRLFDASSAQVAVFDVEPEQPQSDGEFGVTFNIGSGELTFTSASGLFNDIDQVNISGESPTGNPGYNSAANSAAISINDDYSFTIYDAWNYFVGTPGDDLLLQYAEFVDSGSAQIGEWNGAVTIEQTPVTLYAYWEPSEDVIYVSANMDYFYSGMDVEMSVDAATYAISEGPSVAAGYIIDSPTQVRLPFNISDDGSASGYGSVLDYILFYDGQPNEATFTGPVNLFSVPVLYNASSEAEDTLTIDGDFLDTAYRFRVIGSAPAYSQYYYDSAGPNAGLNPVGSTVTVSQYQAVIEDPALSGQVIDYIQARDGSDNVVSEWYGTAAIYDPLNFPLLEGICSPAANTIRFTGQRFLTANLGAVGYIIPRLADYGSVLQGGFMQYELADGSPDFNGWELVTHSDTVIEISNPAFTSDEPSGGPGDFVVQGVAFHDPTTSGYYYLEPWGDPSPYSAPVDGAGC